MTLNVFITFLLIIPYGRVWIYMSSALHVYVCYFSGQAFWKCSLIFIHAKSRVFVKYRTCLLWDLIWKNGFHCNCISKTCTRFEENKNVASAVVLDNALNLLMNWHDITFPLSQMITLLDSIMFTSTGGEFTDIVLS